MIVYDQNLEYFYSTLINDGKYFSGFTTKAYGNALLMETIFNSYRRLNVVYKKIVIMEQIHSVNISVFEPKSSVMVEKISETDGVITKQPQTALSVQTADCVPIIFVDKSIGIIGISHQGWRGSLKKMAQKVVEKMSEIGSQKKNIVAAIGPCIGPCCYDVDEDLYYTFLDEVDGYSQKVFHQRGSKHYLNLMYLNYLLLVDAGVNKEHIDFFPFCTKCDAQRFFSFRRGAKKEFSEMLSFVVRRS